MESLKINEAQFNWRNRTIYYRKDSVDIKVIEHSFDNDIFYSSINEFLPTGKMNIIDIGAHIGTFSILSASKYPDAKIYAFDPFPETYSLLERNIISNKIQQVHTYSYALSNKNESRKLFLSDENWEHSTINSDSNKSIVVEGKRLDTFIEEEKIRLVDLIKFNCEGAEFEILKSISNETFKKIKMMVILFHEDMAQDFLRTDIYNIINTNNFIYREINSSKNRGWIIAKNPIFYSKTNNLFLKIEYQLSIVNSKILLYLKKIVKWIIKK